MEVVNIVFQGKIANAFNLEKCHHIFINLQIKDQYPQYVSTLHLGRPSMLVIKYLSAIHPPPRLLEPSVHSQRHKAHSQIITILLFATGSVRLMAGNLIQNRDVAAIHINRLLCRLADHLPKTLPPVHSLRVQTKTYVADVYRLLRRRPSTQRLNLSHLLQFILDPDIQTACFPPKGRSWQIAYEPELIGAIHCKLFFPIHINIFSTGRAVILGVRNRFQLRRCCKFLHCLFKRYL